MEKSFGEVIMIGLSLVLYLYNTIYYD